MTFHDRLVPDGNAFSPQPKTQVSLVQLSPKTARPTTFEAFITSGTSFECDDDFAWIEPREETPDDHSAVPPRTETDLASIPPFLWGLVASYGRQTLPAILHDVRCDQAKLAGSGAGGRAYQAHLRRKADQQFRHTLRFHAGTGPATRWIMWSAVRLFGFLPLGAAMIAGVLVALLHYSASVFDGISAVLSSVTIWPWLSWLDVVPRGLAWLFQQGSVLVRPDRTFVIVMAVIGVGLLVSLVVRSIERPAPDANRHLSAPALFSLLGACLISAVTAPPLLPLVIVTLVTHVVLLVLDLLLYWVVERPFTWVASTLSAKVPGGDKIPDSLTRTAPPPPLRGLFPKS